MGRLMGSGLLMAVSFLDPGNLEADIQAGVNSGFHLLWWFAVCSIVFGMTFQVMAARLGVVTGKDLAQHCGQEYPKAARYVLWFMLELAIVGADIQETVGSAIAVYILSGRTIPLWAGCILISITAFALLLLERLGYRQLESVFAIFIAVEAIAMGVNFAQAQIPALPVLRGLFVPYIPASAASIAVAALGAIVMPYNIYFHSSLVNQRQFDSSTDAHKNLVLTYFRIESFVMLVLAFLVNLFVVCVFAQGFYGKTTEVDMGLESAGDHLGETYGNVYKYVWAVGLLASGQVATIGLTYAGQLVMTGMLGIDVKAGTRMVATRMVALVPTVLLAVAFEATNSFDHVAQMLNVLQSMQLPFALIPAMYMTSQPRIMGPAFVTVPWMRVLSNAVLVAVLGVNLYLLVDLSHSWLPQTALAYTIFGIITSIYHVILLYFLVGPSNVDYVLSWLGLGSGPGLERKSRGSLLRYQKLPSSFDRELAMLSGQESSVDGTESSSLVYESAAGEDGRGVQQEGR